MAVESGAEQQQHGMSRVNMEARLAFKSGVTRSLQWRLRQLDAISTLVTKHESQLCQAAFTDLGKSPFEVYSNELGFILNACKLMKKNLKKWTGSTKVKLPLMFQPSACEIVAEPLGVVLIFSTWNFPIIVLLDLVMRPLVGAIAAEPVRYSRNEDDSKGNVVFLNVVLDLAMEPLVGAVAAGNAVVLKLSEVAPAVSALLAKLIPIYMDKHAVKVVQGDAVTNQELLEQKWDKIFFTGSSKVGKIVMSAAAKHLTPVTLELGGKCPIIVDRTSDLEVMGRRITMGKWGINSGQACVAPDYVLIEKAFAPRLITALKKTLRDFFGNDPEESSDFTRIVNKRHFTRLSSYLQPQNVMETICHGGICNEKTLYIEPTILIDPPLDSDIMTEEIFGPILPIITVPTVGDAIDFVNSRPKPLALYLFTNDEIVKTRVRSETSTGSLVVNEVCLQFGLQMMPFGGIGESGHGKYHGKCSFDTFSHMKSVLSRPFTRDVLLRYPPFTPEKQLILRHVVDLNLFRFLLSLLLHCIRFKSDEKSGPSSKD